MHRRPPTPTLFPYTTLFRSGAVRALDLDLDVEDHLGEARPDAGHQLGEEVERLVLVGDERVDLGEAAEVDRSEEHTSELQSPCNLVCRLLLEKKKQRTT